MKKSQFSESQIVKILKSVEGGLTVAEVCRQSGISSSAFYKWKSKYGGMEVADIMRLKDLANENRR